MKSIRFDSIRVEAIAPCDGRCRVGAVPNPSCDPSSPKVRSAQTVQDGVVPVDEIGDRPPFVATVSVLLRRKPTELRLEVEGRELVRDAGEEIPRLQPVLLLESLGAVEGRHPGVPPSEEVRPLPEAPPPGAIQDVAQEDALRREEASHCEVLLRVLPVGPPVVGSLAAEQLEGGAVEGVPRSPRGDQKILVGHPDDPAGVGQPEEQRPRAASVVARRVVAAGALAAPRLGRKPLPRLEKEFRLPGDLV
eukprot:CAMPEP_0197180736 /NCGR_PEP_ID=MMETSP1423-20130617/5245_1 /TAXON_ID=476441 /ORGANISM="Pseudo-nitzschia heimii, Strain UNC1101" /LENGTH=248 /DNA_ID=CAMNT_0042630855 /DNA_START=516 /DNA_END=1259 /DNA_ORIENTATION=+